MGTQMQRTAAAPGSNAARIEEFRLALLNRADDLTRALAGQIDPQKFMEIALTAVATIKEPETRAKVLNCTPDSFVIAVLQAAQAGLRIDGRQSTVIPFGNVATWMPMVKGRIDLILRAPNVSKVVTRAVMSCDEFDYVLGTEEKIIHRPDQNPPPDAKLTHAYAIVWKKDGTQVFEVLGRARIDQIRASFSKAPDSPAWKKSFNEMAQKCALNRLERLIDTDPDVARAMAQAMAAEFEIPTDEDDAAERAAERVTAQVAEAREKIERLRQLQAPADAQVELRRVLVQKIGAAIKAQKLTRDEAAKEARAGLSLAGMTDYPERDGAPDLTLLAAPLLSVILEHFTALGPGFAGQDQSHPQDAPSEEPASPAGEAPEAAPAPTQAAQEPPPATGAGGKVEPLICRKLGTAKGAKIHVGDPLGGKPPICIGCGKEIGAQAGGAGATAVADWTAYCQDALDAVDERYAVERVPDTILAAIANRRKA